MVLLFMFARGAAAKKSTKQKQHAGEPDTRKELLRTGEEEAKGADPQLSSM
jgi:hypothetical protein